ncbi:hypothetical protein [Propionicimonas sp.]|uniref:hypothetical protein n=1 Tax=Propionicimonas sp. TaxID=1955623 RepID=UPI001801241C|nr:hypothetical protein [Propionicimonas sp.]MBU3978065.1 hypothetical protein [Actinomycetota bacterium]MBA3021950.1 hypothetical protein [Propionicimonas sp.]MBU3985493.1 hypothetical protein [Actinomycetota bacterium]MBU4007656.1 hypothetical protein [Actinomycetota bacterium]MBU4066535.1 hypothetical protein [Actinomycetota bacterium]
MPTPPVAAAEATTSADRGVSSDTQSITQAADDYQAGDPSAAADLAEAASATDAVPMIKTKADMTATTEDGATITVAKDGDVTVGGSGALKVGISVDGTADTTKVSGRVGKYLSSTTALALSAFAASGLALLGDALGIGSCASLLPAGPSGRQGLLRTQLQHTSRHTQGALRSAPQTA